MLFPSLPVVPALVGVFHWVCHLVLLSFFSFGIPPLLHPLNSPERASGLSRSMDSPFLPASQSSPSAGLVPPSAAITVICCIRQVHQCIHFGPSSSFQFAFVNSPMFTPGLFKAASPRSLPFASLPFPLSLVASSDDSTPHHHSVLLMKRSCSSRQNGTPCSRFCFLPLSHLDKYSYVSIPVLRTYDCVFTPPSLYIHRYLISLSTVFTFFSWPIM